MVIIDLKTGLMGVRMGFLAFILIGGTSGLGAWIFYPGKPKNSNSVGLIMVALLGSLAAAISSYLGQYADFFQSGQMLEWISAILASCAIGWIYTALAK